MEKGSALEVRERKYYRRLHYITFGILRKLKTCNIWKPRTTGNLEEEYKFHQNYFTTDHTDENKNSHILITVLEIYIFAINEYIE